MKKLNIVRWTKDLERRPHYSIYNFWDGTWYWKLVDGRRRIHLSSLCTFLSPEKALEDINKVERIMGKVQIVLKKSK